MNRNFYPCSINMALKSSDIKHIAELARLDVGEKEIKTYSRQLSVILKYVNQLEEVKTSEADLAQGFSNLENIWRQDEAQAWPSDEVALALSQSALEKGYLKVKKVL